MRRTNIVALAIGATIGACIAVPVSSATGHDAGPPAHLPASAKAITAVPSPSSTVDPKATPFPGVPTVGALSFTDDGDGAHFCTASVVDSQAGDLLLTAAHCVHGGRTGNGYVGNVAFTPEYHDGQAPLGTWNVQRMLVPDGWAESSDPNLDFAFAVVAPDGSGRSIQAVTGGNRLGIGLGADQDVQVIGYPNGSDRPVECHARSGQAMPGQSRFDCPGYGDGTSGSPWLAGFDPRTGSGTVVGDIGGYEEGGSDDGTSYSPYFGDAIQDLYQQVQQDAG